MLSNYLKITLRILFREKGYAMINVMGLSIALAIVMIMLLWVQEEWYMDKFHANGAEIFRVKRKIPLEGNKLAVYRGLPYPVLKAAKAELPEVEKMIPIGHSFQHTIIKDQNNYRVNGTFANLDYFEAFSFPVVLGDITQIDRKIDAIVISEELAKRLFGNVWRSTALGATIEIYNEGKFTVEAIFEDQPDQSSIQNDYYFSLAFQLKKLDWLLDWGNSGMQGAIQLTNGANPIVVAQKIEAIFQEHQEGERKEGILLQNFC